MKNLIAVSMFDGQCFEKFSEANEETEEVGFFYTIDGKEVEEAQWTQRREQAIARDLATIGLKRP
ncbi:hypothetical protein EON83_27760 [bacterium]|nr:MAG: hypothetical protein EON83_27760 [bacterium]